MPFDAARATTKTEAINAAFAAIGTAGETAMPRAKAKTSLLATLLAAWEYHVASHLLRIAETRRNRAITAAVKAGVIFDHIADPMPVGTSQIIYAGPVIEISVAVSAPIAGIDHAGFVVDLLKAKVDPKLIKRLTAKHATETRAAHKFVSSLVTG